MSKIRLAVIPDAVQRYLGMQPEAFTVGFCVQELLETQRDIAQTLAGENDPGALLKFRFGVLPATLMPAPKGLAFVPISDAERQLYLDMAGFREAAGCMRMLYSLEGWHLPGDGGDAFSGPKGRMSPNARLGLEHLPMMAYIFGYTGIAFHTWLDVHPDDLRAFSLTLLARGLKINSAFHGAFHGPIFARGAMSSPFSEVRYLARRLKREGQLLTLLGWDAATAIEEALIPHLPAGEIDRLRAKAIAEASVGGDPVMNALKYVQRGKASLKQALVKALQDAGVQEDIEGAVEKALASKPDAKGRQCCDWDGTDGRLLHEALCVPASHLDLSSDELNGVQALIRSTAPDPEASVSREDLLIYEKAVRIVVTGGLVRIKVEPKYFDPSAMAESNALAVTRIRDGVERLIRAWITAQVRAEQPGNPNWDEEVERRFERYVGCIVCQVEQGHAVQQSLMTASGEVEVMLKDGTHGNAFHENHAPDGTGLGDPDYPTLVTVDSVRRHYWQIKAGMVGPNSDPARRISTECDMAPHFWDGVLGFLISINVVNTSIAIALLLIKVEAAMQKRGDLSDWEADVQKSCGVLQSGQGIFEVLDTGVIHAALALAFSMAAEGLELVAAAEGAARFRDMIKRPYNDALTTAAIRTMMAA